VRPVDLLPQKYRRKQRTSTGRPGSAYVIVGVLGAVLVGLLLYVSTANKVSSRQAETREAADEAKKAEQRVAALGPFGSFTQIASTRKTSVAQLARERFDYERLMRELARVLPEGTWLTEADAQTTGAADAAGGAAPKTASTAAAAGPSVLLTGCAPRQPDVAKLIVRLRRMHRAQDVSLGESARESVQASGGGAQASPEQGCGKFYKFNVTVSFEAVSPVESGPKRVPATLGGGS
jgi:Tfp pilus assembly protein PilN